ncbi:MAG: type transport system ATP-binding protein [Parcubacteria group bacterium]|nr:type transport system ATP-binding protein [Parcubacteria group bacterium]
MTPAIEIEGLKKKYWKGKVVTTEALKGVSLSIPKGEFFALLGPNGAGKTSLISILAGLGVKTEGTVVVNGVSIDKDPDTAKSFIGLVPQEFNFSIFEKVLDIVIDQAGYYGITKAEAMPYAKEILTALGLWEKRNDQAQTLSGGMKRRLMIARALIHKPEILLLDEPTAGVDVELRRSMWEFLKDLNEKGTTILLTTHYLEEAEQLCRRVAIINHGEIIEEGSVKELFGKLHITTVLLDTVESLTEAIMQLLRGEPLVREDENTLKLTLGPGGTMNEAFRKLSSVGVHVTNVRSMGSRLEEVFIQLIEKKDAKDATA